VIVVERQFFSYIMIHDTIDSEKIKMY